MTHLIEWDGIGYLWNYIKSQVPTFPTSVPDTTMSLRPGPYAIINRKSGTAFTTSDGPDPRAITGSQYDGRENQKV